MLYSAAYSCSADCAVAATGMCAATTAAAASWHIFTLHRVGRSLGHVEWTSRNGCWTCRSFLCRHHLSLALPVACYLAAMLRILQPARRYVLTHFYTFYVCFVLFQYWLMLSITVMRLAACLPSMLCEHFSCCLLTFSRIPRRRKKINEKC